MEGKLVILSVLIMSLVMAQIQVEARSCCPTMTDRNLYTNCLFSGGLRPNCASFSGCILFDGHYYGPCPEEYPHDSNDVVNDYCKLGCASYVCNDNKALRNSGARKIVNGAVEECVKACSVLCTKSSMTGVKTA